MKKSSFKKLKSRLGYTLTEALVTVAILGILVAASAAGITGVLATRRGMIENADSQVLGSTVVDFVAHELRFGQNIKIVTDSGTEILQLDSSDYGEQVRMYLNKDGRIHIVETRGKGTKEDFDVLGEAAYSGLEITKFEFEIKDGHVTADIEISSPKGDVLWSEKLNVSPLNEIV